jgi:hypothetical protein
MGVSSKRAHKRTHKKPVYQVPKDFGRADDRFQRIDDFDDDAVIDDGKDEGDE